jgi:hypothetical protein
LQFKTNTAALLRLLNGDTPEVWYRSLIPMHSWILEDLSGEGAHGNGQNSVEPCRGIETWRVSLSVERRPMIE